MVCCRLDILRFQKWFHVDAFGFQIKLWVNILAFWPLFPQIGRFYKSLILLLATIVECFTVQGQGRKRNFIWSHFNKISFPRFFF
jgi:hypothetical protein